MNVGQNGDPDDCVRFGYLRGLNGGELFISSIIKRVIADAFPCGLICRLSTRVANVDLLQ